MANLTKVPEKIVESTDYATSQLEQVNRSMEEASTRRSVRADPNADARTQILQIAEACNSPNWDGYGAEPIKPVAIWAALFVLEKLPRDTTVPDIVAEPTGGLGFEWENSRGSSLIISVQGDRMMAYVASMGDGGRRRGNERFINFLPPPVLELLEREFRGRE